MQFIDSYLMDDFHQKFLNFFSEVKGIKNIRFNCIRDEFNINIDTFPEDQEVFNIQQANKLNLQSQPNKPKKNWTDDDKKVLIWLVGKWVAQNQRDIDLISDSDWNVIASMMPRRDSFACKQKWLQMFKLPLQQAPWTPVEDNILQTIIQDFENQNKGNQWSQMAQILNKINNQQVHRNGKQCRERWNNHLNPNINRNPWQLSEDLDLMCQAKKLGKKWALISKKLKIARSENNVKNRFNCLIKKERNNKSGQNLLIIRKKKEKDEINSQKSSISNLQSSEELSLEEIKLINIIIKKIECQRKEEVKEENSKLLKKVKGEQQKEFYKEFKEKIQHFKNMKSLQINVIDSNLKDDEITTLMPCLINQGNHQIYFSTPEQFYIYLNQSSETNQLGIQSENYFSIPNGQGSFMYDHKVFQSNAMLQSREYYQGQHGIFNQRSQVNQNHVGYCSSINSLPYQIGLSPYPSHAILTYQLQK
ncbi:unnamed protein product [Paramecium primaurelia]|uniref:Uncharacterized protein n=1 Tax=Paramecium primaurelia TaxID=5886 RepID=A0A8S1MAN6_PARPR|nr:unnamed protein product [Paramecium primaurelia]